METVLSKFMPSVNGFQFNNDPPEEPFISVTLPFIGEVNVGQMSDGLCGGMTFAALDYFMAGRVPPPGRDFPAPKSALSDFLAVRHLAAANPPIGMIKMYCWTAHQLDMDILDWSISSLDVLTHMLKLRPVPLTLVLTKSLSPFDCGKNHVVLAYGISGDENMTKIRICDPNEPLDDNMALTVSKAGLTHPDWDYMRGFFMSDYTKATPPA